MEKTFSAALQSEEFFAPRSSNARPSRVVPLENPCTSIRTKARIPIPSPVRTIPRPADLCARCSFPSTRASFPGHARLQPVPSAHALQAEPYQRQKSRDNQKKLQNLVINRAAQSAEKYVDQNHQRGNQNRNVK